MDPLTRLEQIATTIHDELDVSTEQEAPYDPALVRDDAGRYVLLDAYIALVNGRAARDQLATQLLARPISAEQAQKMREQGYLP